MIKQHPSNDIVQEAISKALIEYIDTNRGVISRDFVEIDLPRTAHVIDEGPETLIIPDGTEKIGRMIFNNCDWLKHISIPQSVKVIGNGAFAGSGIIDCCIPEGVEIIEEGAFFNSQLQIVSLPKSLKKIEHPLVGCRLKKMYFAGEDPNLFLPHNVSEGEIRDIWNLWACDIQECIAYVPTISYDVYRNHWAFKEFKKIIPINSFQEIAEIIKEDMRHDFTLRYL